MKITIDIPEDLANELMQLYTDKGIDAEQVLSNWINQDDEFVFTLINLIKNKKSRKEIKLNLTDSEWIQLIDGVSADTQLPKCCDNVASLRDIFIHLVRNGRNESNYWGHELKQKLTMMPLKL